MTYVEFFDKDAVQNIISCLAKAPDRVILLGDKLKLLKKHSEIYRRIFEQKGFNIEFICMTINKNNLQSIVDRLAHIMENYDDCYFDLTGGEELPLVAMGIIYERYKDIKNIQMHKFNVRNNAVLSCDGDKTIISEMKPPVLTVEENISLYGGKIVYDDVTADGTYKWDYTDDFKKDIDTMWNICKNDVRLWNTQINILEISEMFRGETSDPFVTEAPVDPVVEELRKKSCKFIFATSIFKALLNKGLIESYEINETKLSVKYKNAQVKRCLTKAGQALEMKIYSIAKSLCGSEETAVYNDVMNGICIDWDGDIHTLENEYDTKNEIDVILMKGIVPVFISCKNGCIEMEELYKLNTVADRFGGNNVRKVLIATALNNREHSQYFRQRAADMNIKLIEGIQDMSDLELSKKIKNLWCS